MVVGIIGGGASGMAAALAAAEHEGVEVVLMERQARVGRKLQATGNGRCNLTNLHAMEGGYHGSDPSFVSGALEAFDVTDTLEWFRKLGLLTVAEASGRVYPYSDQAGSVVDVLRFALDHAGIRVETGFEVTKIRRKEGGFLVESGDRSVCCDRSIVACGGLAGTKLGGSMSGYQLLRSMGHHMTKLRPTLVQLKCGWSGVVSLKGVRANCHVTVLRDGSPYAQSQGELQFTEYGLSGPVIFEVSRDVCQGKGDWVCQLDFLPHVPKDVLRRELEDRRDSGRSVEDLLVGIVHNRLGRVLTKSIGLSQDWAVSSLTDQQLEEVCMALKAFQVTLTEPLGMDSAQVTAGGILTEEFDPHTLESRLVPGLYACGEVLDIDGDCGGYNLQWAWSSGRLAGRSAGEEKR